MADENNKEIKTPLADILKKLNESVDAQKDNIDAQLDIVEMDKKLSALEGGWFTKSNENSEAMRIHLEELKNLFENSSGEQREYYKDQLQMLKAGIETEEERREKEKLLEEQTAYFSKMASGIASMEDKMSSFAGKAAKGALGLGLLALLFDPELVLKGITSAVETMTEAFNAISALIDGDITPALDFVSENALGVAIGLGLIAIKFGLMSKIVSMLNWAAKVWRGALLMMQSGILASAITFLAPFAPLIAVVALAAAAIWLVVEYWEDIKDVFNQLGEWVNERLEDLNKWIKDTFGIDIKQELENLWNTITGGGLFHLLKQPFVKTNKWIKDTFGVDIAAELGKLWDEITDGMGLVGLITAPVRFAGDWIAKKFGFEAPEGEEGYVTAMVRKTWEDVKAWLKDMLPSIEDLKAIGDKLNPMNWFDEDKPTDVKKLADMSDEELMAKAKENAGYFGDEGEELMKLKDLQRIERKKQRMKNLGGDYQPKLEIESYKLAPPIERSQPQSNLRQNQSEAIDLTNQATQQQLIAVVERQNQAAPAPAPSVSNQTIHMTNDVSGDTLMKEFVFKPA